jgi:hypothetical protein
MWNFLRELISSGSKDPQSAVRIIAIVLAVAAGATLVLQALK